MILRDKRTVLMFAVLLLAVIFLSVHCISPKYCARKVNNCESDKRCLKKGKYGGYPVGELCTDGSGTCKVKSDDYDNYCDNANCCCECVTAAETLMPTAVMTEAPAPP